METELENLYSSSFTRIILKPIDYTHKNFYYKKVMCCLSFNLHNPSYNKIELIIKKFKKDDFHFLIFISLWNEKN